MSISQNFPNTRPSLNLNFARSQTLDPRITFTRTTSGTRVGPDGYIEVIPADQPRFDFDPVTGECLGLLIEEQRENLVRNNTAQGAVVGTPGTNPTNSYFFISPSGISKEITAIGVENGITYFDVRYYGTSTSTGEISWAPQVATLSPVTAGQTVSASVYLKVVSGDFTNIGSLSIRVLDYGPGYLRESSTLYSTSLLQSSGLLRYSHTRTTGTSTTGVVFSITLNKTISGPVDITLRIGMPQIEIGSFTTSVIPTSGSTVTRTADNAKIDGNNFTNFYNPSEGTIFCSANNNPGVTTTTSRFFYAFERSDGTSADFIRKWIWSGNTGLLLNSIYTSNSGPIAAEFNTTLETTNKRTAIAYKQNDFARSYNGYTPSTDNIGNLPVGINQVRIGTNLSGHIAQLTYYPVRLPNNVLQTLTK